MENFKHTPGPWKIEEPNFEELEICTDEINIGTILRQGEYEEQGEANAKLIAAAPEILDALIDVLRILNLKPTHDNLYQRNKIEYLINKATK